MAFGKMLSVRAAALLLGGSSRTTTTGSQPGLCSKKGQLSAIADKEKPLLDELHDNIRNAMQLGMDATVHTSYVSEEVC